MMDIVTNPTPVLNSQNPIDYREVLARRIGELKKPEYDKDNITITPSANETRTTNVMKYAIPIAAMVEAIATKGKGNAVGTYAGNYSSGLEKKKELYAKRLADYNTEYDKLAKELNDVNIKANEANANMLKQLLDAEKTRSDIQKNEWEMAKPSADQIEINKEDRKALREAKTLSDKTAAADKIITTLDIKDPLKREAVRQLLIKGEGLGDIYKAELEARTKALEAGKKKDDGTNVSNPVRALDIANSGLGLIDQIRANPSKDFYFAPFVGTARSLNPLTGGKAFSGGETSDLEVAIDGLRSKLTTANLDLMKGVLSNNDIKILERAATSLSKLTTKQAFMDELDRVEDVFLRNKTALEKLVPVEQRVVPSETTPGVTKKNRVWNPKLGRVE